MASTDFTEIANSESFGNINRGVSSALTPPPGGGAFVYGFNSASPVVGSVAYYSNQPNFVPVAKGGSISACLRRGAGTAKTGFSPFIFIGLQDAPSPSVLTSSAYILGLSDGDPYYITLVKGVIGVGVPDVVAPNPTVNGVLSRSTLPYTHTSQDRVAGPATAGLWHHLRLDMIVNTGDVLLKVFENDLTANPIGTTPVWTTPPGFAAGGFIDDALTIATGTLPFTSGFMGYGFESDASNRLSYIDQWAAARQTP